MNKILLVILQTLGGFTISASGVLLGYLYLTKANLNNPLILIAAILLFPSGGYLLYRAGKQDDIIIVKTKKPILLEIPELQTDDAGLDKTLEKNNALSSQWSKTIEQRDKLRMLELADPGNTKS